MIQQSTETKRLLSHVIANWACALNYEDLSPEAIQAAKLFWFDSIGCALGGSQQEDAKILLKHYRALSNGNGKTTAFVSGFKTNPVDAAFLNGHMIRAMDYNDIYWKADPCHPSDLIAAPLALCESEGLSGKTDQHEKYGRSMGRPHGRRERVARAQRVFRSRAHHRRQRRFVRRFQSCALQGRTGNVRWRRVGQGPA